MKPDITGTRRAVKKFAWLPKIRYTYEYPKYFVGTEVAFPAKAKRYEDQGEILKVETYYSPEHTAYHIYTIKIRRLAYPRRVAEKDITRVISFFGCFGCIKRKRVK